MLSSTLIIIIIISLIFTLITIIASTLWICLGSYHLVGLHLKRVYFFGVKVEFFSPLGSISRFIDGASIMWHTEASIR